MPDQVPARDYPRLFAAMNEVLKVFSVGGDEQQALRRSFEDVACGFGAEKALLLVVDGHQPLRLRSLSSRGLSEKHIEACERGASVKGVSSSVIRTAIETRKLALIEPPLADDTPALAGQHLSVLCSPILDPFRDVVLAVMYLQNTPVDEEHIFRASDAVWLEGYASALRQTFAFHFEEKRRERELKELLANSDRPENAPEIIGDSAHTQALRGRIHETYIPAAEAPDPDPLLILGEKGTGKDLVARYLHAYCARHEHPFVAVNCAEITDEMVAARLFGHRKGAFTGAVSDEPGFFRAANKGFLFLDEIGDLSPKAQASLLRVLENRTIVPVGETREIRVDVQVVLATNKDPEQAAREGQIRPDLLDRFKTHSIHLEPLRQHPWDIPVLARHFIAYNERRTRKKSLGVKPEAMRALVSYSWPGNVRELARVCSLLITHVKPGAAIDHALLGQCCPDLLTASPNPRATPIHWEDVPLRKAIRDIERELILSRLERHNWNLRSARESLGLPKTTFQRYAVSLGISVPGHPLGKKLEE